MSGFAEVQTSGCTDFRGYGFPDVHISAVRISGGTDFRGADFRRYGTPEVQIFGCTVSQKYGFPEVLFVRFPEVLFVRIETYGIPDFSGIVNKVFEICGKCGGPGENMGNQHAFATYARV